MCGRPRGGSLTVEEFISATIADTILEHKKASVFRHVLLLYCSQHTPKRQASPQKRGGLISGMHDVMIYSLYNQKRTAIV